jgi:hypothetical protein
MGNAARMREMRRRSILKIWSETSRGRDHLGGARSRCEENIKIYLKDFGNVELISRAEDRI